MREKLLSSAGAARGRRMVLVAAVAAVGGASSAIAAPYEVTWAGGSGDYNATANWTAFTPPFIAPYNRPDTTVENPFLNIANGSTATISGAAEGAFLMLGMRVGETGNLIIDAGSNTVSLGELRVGGREVIPDYIAGTNTPNGGGTGSVVQNSGTVNITYRDPTNTEPPIQSLYIGDSGLSSGNTAVGSYTIKPGATLLSGIALDDAIAVGTGTGAQGTFIQDGGTVTSTGFVSIGRRGGTGSWTMADGVLNVLGTGNNYGLWVGDGETAGVAGGTGTFTQTGGAVNVTTTLDIGRRAATGIYNISAGTITAGGINIGGNAGNTTSAQLAGNGTMTISGTAQVTSTGNFNAGLSPNGTTPTPGSLTGTLNLTGGSLTLSAAGAVFGIGNGRSSTGTVNISGGSLTMTGATSVMELRRNTGVSGTLNISGGTVNVRSIVGNAGTVNISGGTSTIDSMTFTTGALNLSGTSSTTITAMTLGTNTILKSDGTQSLGTNITIGNATANVNSGSLTLSGALISNTSGGRTLTKTGAGTLNVNGTQTHNFTGDAITNSAGGGILNLNADGGTNLGVNAFSGTTNFGANQSLRQITVNGASGAAVLNVGASNVSTTSAVTLTKGTLTGTTGVISGNSFVVAEGTVSAILGGAGGLTKNGANTVTLSRANTYAGGSNVTAGTLIAADADALGTGTLILNGTSTVTAQAGLSKALDISTILVAGGAIPTATLNLTNNSLALHNATLGTHDAINELVEYAFDGFAWDRPGITSTTVANDIANGVPKTLGILFNNDGGGNVLFYGDGGDAPQFEGRSVDANTVLVKYTLLGDGDLNGTVDSVDFALFQAGFDHSAPYTSFAFGDYNYDGFVDSVDFGLFQAGFDASNPLTQPTLAAAIAEFASANGLTLGATAVPEPATLGVLGLAACGLLARRRRA